MGPAIEAAVAAAAAAAAEEQVQSLGLMQSGRLHHTAAAGWLQEPAAGAALELEDLAGSRAR